MIMAVKGNGKERVGYVEKIIKNSGRRLKEFDLNTTKKMIESLQP